MVILSLSDERIHSLIHSRTHALAGCYLHARLADATRQLLRGSANDGDMGAAEVRQQLAAAERKAARAARALSRSCSLALPPSLPLHPSLPPISPLSPPGSLTHSLPAARRLAWLMPRGSSWVGLPPMVAWVQQRCGTSWLLQRERQHVPLRRSASLKQR